MPRIIFQRHVAMQNLRRLPILGCLLKPEEVERRFKIDNLDFFILVDERSLGSKVFMIIKI